MKLETLFTVILIVLTGLLHSAAALAVYDVLPPDVTHNMSAGGNREQINNESPDEPIQVAIYLKDQPFFGISKKYRDQFDPKIRDIQQRIKADYQKARALAEKPGTAKFEDEILTDLSSQLEPGAEQEIAYEKKKIEKLKHKMVTDILDETGQKIKPQQNRLKKRIREMGGSVNGEGIVINVIFVRIPANRIHEIEQFPEVESIEEVGLYTTTLDTSTYSLKADVFWNNYTGSTIGVAVADTGIDKTHPALSVGYEGVFHAAAIVHPEYYYNDNPTGPDDLHGHGTHVAGIVGSSDSSYRGVASGAVLMNAKFGFLSNDTSYPCLGSCGLGDWSDAIQAIDWALDTSKGDGAEVVSFSFGGYAYGNDSSMARYFDAFIDGLGVVGVVSAGNSGFPQTIADPAIAYNVITVGAMDDYANSDRTNDDIAYYSSRGPVPNSERIKPDLMAPGSNIRSAYNKWEAGSDFIFMSGTSMAAPHIAGAAALLMQSGISDPREIKALLINTAEDRGDPGGDYDYGWGYVDLNHTFYHLSDVQSGTVNSSQRYIFYKGTAVNLDKASIVWNRHAVYKGPEYPTEFSSLSDLNLYMYRESDGSMISGSDSSDENVEQVVSNADASVILKINASAFGTGILSEQFALATEEGFTVAQPGLGAVLSHPAVAGLNEDFNVTVTVANTGEVTMHNVSVTLSLPSPLTLTGNDCVNVSSIGPGNMSNVTWMVHSASTGGLYSMETLVLSDSYAENISASNASSIFIDNEPPIIIGNPTMYEPSFTAANNGSRITINTTIIDVHSSVQNAYVEASPVNNSLVNLVRLVHTNGFWINDTIIVGAPDGFYLLNVTSYDVLGNQNTSAQITVHVDNSPPYILPDPVHYPDHLTGATNGTAIRINVSAADTDGGSGIKNITANVSAINSSGLIYLEKQGNYWSGEVVAFAADGDHTVEIIGMDNASNVNSNLVNVTMDSTRPTINTVAVQPALITTSASVNITAVVTDPNMRNVTADITYPDGTTMLYRMNGGPGYYLIFNDTMDRGRYNVTILAEDSAGNTNTALTSFIAATLYANESVTVPAFIATFVNATAANVTLEMMCNTTITGWINITRSTVSLVDESVHSPGVYVRINASGDFSDNDYANVTWAMIRVYYTEEEIHEYVESSLRLYWFNESSSDWVQLSTGQPSWVLGTGLNMNENYIWANVTHFSDYAIGGDLAAKTTIIPSGSGGGGGGGGGTGEDSDNIECFEIDRQFISLNAPVNYHFSLGCNIVDHINFTGLSTSGRVVGKVEILKNTSTLVKDGPSDIIFKNLNVWLGFAGWANENSIKDVTISFMVDNSWVKANNIDKGSITLKRYAEDSWIPLKTEQTGENDTVLMFTAGIPPDGFGNFAVTGVAVTQKPAVPARLAVSSPSLQQNTTLVEPSPGSAHTGWLIIGPLILISAGSLGYWKKEEMHQWIDRHRS